MWIQRCQQGETVEVWLNCRLPDGTVVLPTAAPVITIYDKDAAVVQSNLTMFPANRAVAAGLFLRPVFVGSSLVPAIFVCHIEWSNGGNNYAEVCEIHVSTGGSEKGSIVGIECYDRPQASFVVTLNEVGELVGRKNPRETLR